MNILNEEAVHARSGRLHVIVSAVDSNKQPGGRIDYGSCILPIIIWIDQQSQIIGYSF